MSGGLVTVVTIAVMAVLATGEIWRVWKNHRREMAAIDARALEHKRRMDAQLATHLQEIKQSTTQVKSSLKKSSKEAKRHGKH